MNLPHNSLIFVLGCERSGTTWLANIMDSSPETLLFMEPFSIPYRIFSEFPERSYFLENSSPYLDHFLRTKFPARLTKYKKLFSEHAIYEPNCFRREKWLSQLGYKQKRFLPEQLKKRLMGFQLLNLNRMDDDFPIYQKNRRPAIWAIKELRLAGKIPVLLSAFPHARFLVIIRHPVATVNSILTWFGRGRLTELRRELEVYLEKIEVQSVSKPYKRLLDLCRNGTLAHKTALYWRISYETLFKRLVRHPNAHFLVYEQLASQPKSTVEEVFAKFNIPWSTSVTDYLSYSSRSNPVKPTALNTVRESRTYFQAWCSHVSDDLRQSVDEITFDSTLTSHFEPYYNF